MKKLILLACSARKASKPCKAVDMYQGTLFKCGRAFAERNGYDILILSAKYGWLKPDQVIQPYNQKRDSVYAGEWPQGEGYFLGGALYFKNAPERFQPLVPSSKLGYMVQYAKQLTDKPITLMKKEPTAKPKKEKTEKVVKPTVSNAMLKALKFVQGAVAKKDFVPALTHFRIRNRKVTGYNGSLGLCSPIDVDLDVAPRGNQFVKAVSACVDTITLHVADNGKLCLRSGNFTTFIDCDGEGTYPDIQPSGQIVQLTESLLPALRALAPFIAEDASRPWACGVLFDNESAYATNNIVFVEYWLGFKFPLRVNIPAMAVQELLRVGEDPVSIQITENRIVFHYAGGEWLSTQTLLQEWPDAAALMARLDGTGQEDVPVGFWEVLEHLLPFADEINKCHLLGDRISTTAEDDKSGTSIRIRNVPDKGIYNGKHLLNLRNIATAFNFQAYPGPTPFYGPRTRGLISGIRA